MQMTIKSTGDISAALGEDFNPSQYIGKTAYTTNEPPRLAAYKVMLEYGMRPPAAFPVGQLFRFADAQDKAGKKSAWATYYEYTIEKDTIGICVFGSWHGQPEKVVWSSKRPDYMSEKERRQFTQHIEHAKGQKTQAQEKVYEKTAEQAKQKWDAAFEFDSTDYTKNKGIIPYGAKHNGFAIVLPIMCEEKIYSLQFILDSGDKKFMPGGRIKGCYMRIPGKMKFCFVTEGWSTACSIHEATGATVYIAFNASNLPNVVEVAVSKEDGPVLIAADDDYKNEINAGLKYAKIASELHGARVIAPVFKDEKNRGTDFNDLHSLEGLDTVRKQLVRSYENKTSFKINGDKENREKFDNIEVPPGVISYIYKYYMATSGSHQPGFALQTALAVASCITGRYFITDMDNHSTLYFLNVGKTATGKEHCKKVIDKILRSSGMEQRIAGDGFTSSGAVLSLLLAKPCCITVIDEFGKYLEAAANTKGGMQKEANTSLMECISRPDGVLRPKNYSTATLTKDQADAIRDRYIYCPSLTLLGLTTPNTFFDQIKLASVLDGFLNRFIVYVSDAERAPRKRTRMLEVPQKIIHWVEEIDARIKRNNSLELAQEMPTKHVLEFTEEAYEIQREFELEMIDLQNSLEKIKLDGLPGRSNEWAMRLSLILALSRESTATKIEAQDMQWSVDYMRQNTQRLLSEVIENISETGVEAAKKEILSSMRLYPDGILWRDMQTTSPFSKYETKQLKEYLQSLVDGELIEKDTMKTGIGRPSYLFKLM